MRNRDARGAALYQFADVVRVVDVGKSPKQPLSALRRGVVRELLVDGLRVWVLWHAEGTEQLLLSAELVCLLPDSDPNAPVPL